MRSKGKSKSVRGRIDWRLTRFLGLHLALGATAGWAFVAALLWHDVGGLGALVRSSGEPVLVVGMLLAVMTITWGALAMGTAVFLLPKDDDDEPRGGKKEPVKHPGQAAQQAEPVPVRISA